MARLSTATVVLLLPLILTFVRVIADGGGEMLRRQKREWIIPAKKLYENVDYRKDVYIAKIRSDKQYMSKVKYSLVGIGADQDPKGLFQVEEETGLVTITEILDREKMSNYKLYGVAKYGDGRPAEKDIELEIIVLDQNDCPPVFAFGQTGSVFEASETDYVIVKMNATDDDEPNTPFSQITYSIEGISNSDGMFSINQQTGDILVHRSTLDRETKDTYTLTIIGTDDSGKRGANTGTGQVVIKVLDINDNVPTLEKEYYEGSVEENTVNMEVLRVKAIDLDQQFTDNWLAVFTIVSGNEAGYFNITTDTKTNEGVVMIQRSVDYEELKEVNLGISVANKAAYNFGSSSSGSIVGGGTQGGVKTYPAKINVVNQKEGPIFQPRVKVVTVSEDSSTVTINKVITTYTAIDSDTKMTATNVKYAKIKDSDNWVSVNEKTGEISLNKLPDRESKYLVNGTYYAEIIVISKDEVPKTATGTIAIQVEDFNDHCPTLTATTTTMCYGENAVYATAVDGDSFPNGAPFLFKVIQDDTSQKWTVENINATTVLLRDHAHLWSGFYSVVLQITDQQGKACATVQTLNVAVCTCHDVTKVCLARQTNNGATLGASAILLLLLGLLLLLLVPLLLLFCLCGGAAAIGNFKAIPFDSKGGLMTYHTEGQGEDKEVPLMMVPFGSDHHNAGMSIGNAEFHAEASGRSGAGLGLGMASGAALGMGSGLGLGMRSGAGQTSYSREQSCQYLETQGDSGFGRGANTMDYNRNSFFSANGQGYDDGMALSEGFLENYYSAKVKSSAQNDYQKDSLLVYDYEGQGSPVGSIGCCSLLGGEDDLAFLNDLGPKFKTLASICRESVATEAETVHSSVHSSVHSTSPRLNTSTQHDFSRDTALTGNNILNTSSFTSNSSAQIQESQVHPVGSTTISNVHVQDNVVIPSQTVLIQQPNMYYTAAPMYVVENQPKMVLVDQRGGGGYVHAQAGGLEMGQGFVQVGGLGGSQGMLLVERQVGVGGGGERMVTLLWEEARSFREAAKPLPGEVT
ncbi:hypothetical protein DPEC_G00065490 [Dallia pectoralis]|uniref:Uncharacterized protein n=1 Tax=Dallia pectoralis TaxID=75939 RepID=A0ACC2H809_DALPE|nr:hypothetical protein DPEC_G00065490 [Dallia pectoralis]